MPTSPSRARRTLAALLVLVPLALAIVPFVFAPRTSAQLPLLVGTTELGPVIALGALVLALLARRAARGASRLRRVIGVAAAASVGLAFYPAWATRGVVRRGADEIAALGGGGSPAATAADGGPLRLGTMLRGLPVADGVVERRVPFAAADGSRLEARVFRGRTCVSACPAIAVLYGGAWRNGDASQATAVHRHLAGLGYVVLALDYRHAPAHRYPSQTDDVRQGLSLLADSAAAWGADIGRVAMWGRSSGAHLAMLGAFAPGVADPRVHVRGVVDFYGPYDLVAGYTDLPSPDPLDVRQILVNFLGGTPTSAPAAYRAGSVATYVRPGLPPTLLVYAQHDHIVLARFGRTAAAALRAAGNGVVYVEMPLAEHGFDFVPAGVNGQAALYLAERFLAHVL